jgi:hypothetical protein
LHLESTTENVKGIPTHSDPNIHLVDGKYNKICLNSHLPLMVIQPSVLCNQSVFGPL